MGLHADEFTVQFNRIFSSHWGKEAAIVFDTNIYGIGWTQSRRLMQSIIDRQTCLQVSAHTVRTCAFIRKRTCNKREGMCQAISSEK